MTIVPVFNRNILKSKGMKKHNRGADSVHQSDGKSSIAPKLESRPDKMKKVTNAKDLVKTLKESPKGTEVFFDERPDDIIKHEILDIVLKTKRQAYAEVFKELDDCNIIYNDSRNGLKEFYAYRQVKKKFMGEKV